MSLLRDRVDTIIQYALAVARCVHDDDWMLRDLGQIHLLKYVYVADVAYAKREGASFSGADWTFHHFGPWAAEVRDRIPEAAHAIAAQEKRIASDYRDEDFLRWQVPDAEEADELCRRLRETLPFQVALAVRQAVKDFGNNTTDLLHHVYRTEPMLHAAPGERLDFSHAKMERPGAKPTQDEASALSGGAFKRRKAMLDEARSRFHEAAQARLRDHAAVRAMQPEPRYDDVFEEGTRYLDALAGPPLEGVTGVLEVGDGVWKSPARRGLGADEDG